MFEPERAEVVVIGVGNEFRSDDGLGISVAKRLRERLEADIEVVIASGEGAELIDLWQGKKLAVVIDAISSGGNAGSLYWIDATQESLPASLRLFSTHKFGVGEAIEMSRAILSLPERLIVCGIEGKNFSFGDCLSAEVAEASKLLEQRLSDYLGGEGFTR